MSTWIGIVLVGLVVVGAAFVWGVLRIRRRYRDAEELALSVVEADLPALTAECIEAFGKHLGVRLSLDAPDEAARALDLALDAGHQFDTAVAFERDDHPGWYVRPLGAFLGELIRRHANSPGRWHRSDLGGLALTLGEGERTVTLHPFDKILKQRATGDPGDLIAYVALSRRGVEEMLPPD